MGLRQSKVITRAYEFYILGKLFVYCIKMRNLRLAHCLKLKDKTLVTRVQAACVDIDTQAVYASNQSSIFSITDSSGQVRIIRL